MMTRIWKLTFGFPLCATVGIVAGCGDDSGTEPPCNWIFDPGDCRDDSDQGNDEVGDGDGDGDGDRPDDDDADHELSDACVANPDDRTRTVYQCEGSLDVSIAFNTLLGDCGKTLGDPGWCDEVHAFGLGFEAYAMPAVMACCDAAASPEDEILRMCSVDLVEQLCLSLPKRIQMLIDDGRIKLGKNQARRLRDWLKDNMQPCYNAFNNQSETPGVLEPGAWLVNGGDNHGWSLLNNFTITLESAAVVAATLPDSEDDYVECKDNNYNNGEVFEDFEPVSPGIDTIKHLASGPRVAIVGPTYANTRVHGSAVLASQATGCTAPWCSTVELTEEPSTGTWTLRELSLFASGPVTISFGDLSFEIDRAAVRLYGVSRGAPSTEDHVIEPGAAHFILSGAMDSRADARWATNTTPIVIHTSGKGSNIEAFTITHIDGDDVVWTINIPESRWD